MILNFANSEVHFHHTSSIIHLKDRVSEKCEFVCHKCLDEVNLIMDIQEKLMFVFNVWSIDRDNFDKIKNYVRAIKMEHQN